MTESPSPGRGVKAWVGQILLYGLFAVGIGVFSHWPAYRHLAPDVALIKLSLVHAGQLVGECRKRTTDELAQMPENMRTPLDCPRERSPLTVELDIDGESVARVHAPPSGLSRDGASSVYQRLTVPAGERLITVRLRDDASRVDFTHTLERRIALAPAQVLVIDFDADKGAITLQ